VDFGHPQHITSIEYCFWNDENLFEKYKNVFVQTMVGFVKYNIDIV